MTVHRTDRCFYPLAVMVVLLATGLGSPPALSASGPASSPFTLVGLLHDDRALNRPHDVAVFGDRIVVVDAGTVANLRETRVNVRVYRPATSTRRA